MEFDIYGQREMTDAVLQMAPVSDFFLRTFFNKGVKEHNSDVVDFDIYKGKKLVAPYGRASAKSRPLARAPMQTGSFTLPYIKINRGLEAAMVAQRQPGESLYSNKTPLQRAAEIIATDLREMNDAIDRAEELQAAQAIIYGKVTIRGFEIDAEIDLRRDALNFFSVDPTDTWDSETADIHAALRGYRKAAFDRSGLVPNIIIAGANVLDALFLNQGVRELLDARRVVAGEFNTNTGAVPYPTAVDYGTFAGFRFVEYFDNYIDMLDETDGPEGTVKPLIPDDHIILASTQARCIRHYGAIKDFGAMVPLRRFAKSVLEQDPSTRTAILQSSPAMINHQPDSSMLIKVLNV